VTLLLLATSAFLLWMIWKVQIRPLMSTSDRPSHPRRRSRRTLWRVGSRGRTLKRRLGWATADGVTAMQDGRLPAKRHRVDGVYGTYQVWRFRPEDVDRLAERR
jgi:hypothetical protein